MRERERERSRARGSALGAPDLGFPVAHERPRARGGCGAGGQPPAGPGHVAPWPETATAAGDARCSGRGRGAAARPGNAVSQRHLPGRHAVGRWRRRTRATAAAPRCWRRWPPWPRVGRDREREGADERERGRGRRSRSLGKGNPKVGIIFVSLDYEKKPYKVNKSAKNWKKLERTTGSRFGRESTPRDLGHRFEIRRRKKIGVTWRVVLVEELAIFLAFKCPRYPALEFDATIGKKWLLSIFL